MDIEMFKTLYKTLVRPHLEYASVIWSPYLKKDKISIENVQRASCKWRDAQRAMRNFSPL